MASNGLIESIALYKVARSDLSIIVNSFDELKGSPLLKLLYVEVYTCRLLKQGIECPACLNIYNHPEYIYMKTCLDTFLIEKSMTAHRKLHHKIHLAKDYINKNFHRMFMLVLLHIGSTRKHPMLSSTVYINELQHISESLRLQELIIQMRWAAWFHSLNHYTVTNKKRKCKSITKSVDI